MSAISSESPRFTYSTQQKLEHYESQIDIVGEELAKVTDDRWDRFHLRLESLSFLVNQVGRNLIESSEIMDRIQDKLKKAEDLLKAKTIQFFDQQLEAFSKEVSDISPSQAGTEFSQCVARLFTLKKHIDQGIKKVSLSEDEKDALKKLDTKIAGLFSIVVKKLPPLMHEEI